MKTQTLLLGQTLRFTGNPLSDPWEETVHIDSDGGVLIEGAQIKAVGRADDLRKAHPQATVQDYGDRLICPGFVDAHVHYPQTAIIASWGKRLIDWLNSYTFPEEMRLSDPAYARDIAGRYLDLTLANGTTTVCSFATIAPTSVDAIFDAAAERGQRIVAGKTCMDRNAPEGLRDTAQSAYDDSKMLIDRWHGKGRASYAITPRFTPTSTPEQLAALGALWTERPDCLMQTHLSEQIDEIAWVQDLVPHARDYLDRSTDLRTAAHRWCIVPPRTPSSDRDCSTWRISPRSRYRLAWPRTPAADRRSRCCAQWLQPMRSVNCAAPPPMRRN